MSPPVSGVLLFRFLAWTGVSDFGVAPRDRERCGAGC